MFISFFLRKSSFEQKITFLLSDGAGDPGSSVPPTRIRKSEYFCQNFKSSLDRRVVQNLTPLRSPIKSCTSHIKPIQLGKKAPPVSNIANEKTGNEPALLFGFFNKSTNKGRGEIYGKCGTLDFLYYLGREGDFQGSQWESCWMQKTKIGPGFATFH